MIRSSYNAPTAEDVQREIRNLVTSLDRLRRSASRDSRDQLDALRQRAEQLLHSSRWDSACSSIVRTTRDLGQSARERPVSTVVLGIGAGALIGWLASHR